MRRRASAPSVLRWSIASLLGMAAMGIAAGEAPWWVPVPGHKPVQPGEHPRLFFRKDDVPALRRRAGTAEGKAMVARLRHLLGGGESMPTTYNPTPVANGASSPALPIGTTYTLWHGMGFGMLWQLTGERKYADLGRQCVEKAFAGAVDRDNRYAWVKCGSGLRAGPVFSAIAEAYDLCYDGWDEAFRTEVARQLTTHSIPSAAGIGPVSVERAALQGGAPMKPQSNHWPLYVGGAGIATLAVMGDPGVDEAKTRAWLDGVEKNTIRALSEGYGDGGYFHEHPGPGQVGSTLCFEPMFQAMKVAAGRDWITPRPNARWIPMSKLLWSIPFKDGPRYPNPHPDGGYGTELLDRGGGHAGGHFAQGFGMVRDEEKAALLWVYRTSILPDEARFYPDRGLQPGEPSYDALLYPQRAVFALVNWPLDLQPRNPAEVVPRVMTDTIHHFYVFRNRWQDGDDIAVALLLGARADGARPLLVYGLGLRADFGKVWSRTAPSRFQPAADGSGTLAAGTSALGVDYSKASGAEGLVVLVGAAAGDLKGGGGKMQVQQVTAGSTAFAVLTLSSGAHPVAKADGDRVIVGGQTIAFSGGTVVFGTMAGPPTIGR